MSIQHVVVITGGYPTQQSPFSYTFVEQLVLAFARQGVRCTVIHPVNILKGWRGRLPPVRRSVTVSDGPPVTVLCPRTLSFSNKQILTYNTVLLTRFSFELTVGRVLKSIKYSPDVLYGHFLYSGGRAAVKFGHQLGLPSFVAVGEGIFWGVEHTGFERARREFHGVTGVIAVSSLLKRELSLQIGIPGEHIAVFPNGIDLERFYPRPQAVMRHKFGFPQHMFICAFVGHFYHNKGILRVSEAVKKLDSIGTVYAGSGPLKPTDSHILFQDMLPNRQIPEILSTADIFVLPTLYEGSCNAILEALACGLPVVTSRGEFNDDIVNESVAIRVDPLDVDAIRGAIQRLKNDCKLRQQMRSSALEWIKGFNINVRARNIIEWMESRAPG